MDFSEEYRQKLVSADEAVKVIKSGDWVDYGWCTNTVDTLDKALAKRTDELKDINLRGGILLKPLAVFEREDAGEHFTWNSWHMSGIERHMIARGCAFYSPIRYSELPRYYVSWIVRMMWQCSRLLQWTSMDTSTSGQVLPILVQCVRQPDISS